MSLYPALKNPTVVAPKWWVVNVHGHRVGRIANQISKLLTGKYKPSWNPSVDCGDYVIIVNAKHVEFSGRKWDQKYYRWHTGWVGHLRSVNAKKLHEEKPDEVIKRAVLGMIKKTKTKRLIARRLMIYPEDHHPHDDVTVEEFVPFRTKPELKFRPFIEGKSEQLELSVNYHDTEKMTIKLKKTTQTAGLDKVNQSIKDGEFGYGKNDGTYPLEGFFAVGEPITYKQEKHIRQLIKDGYDGKDWPVKPEQTPQEFKDYVESQLARVRELRANPPPKPAVTKTYPSREDIAAVKDKIKK